MPQPRSLLLCEGRSDEDFFRMLQHARSELQHIELKPMDDEGSGGWSKMPQRLSALDSRGNIRNYETIILMTDGNGDPAERFIEIKRKIEQKNVFNAPAAAWTKSTRKNGLPHVYIAMLPAKDTAGCLETLLVQAIEGASPSLTPAAPGTRSTRPATPLPGSTMSFNPPGLPHPVTPP